MSTMYHACERGDSSLRASCSVNYSRYTAASALFSSNAAMIAASPLNPACSILDSVSSIRL